MEDAFDKSIETVYVNVPRHQHLQTLSLDWWPNVLLYADSYSMFAEAKEIHHEKVGFRNNEL